MYKKLVAPWHSTQKAQYFYAGGGREKKRLEALAQQKIIMYGYGIKFWKQIKYNFIKSHVLYFSNIARLNDFELSSYVTSCPGYVFLSLNMKKNESENVSYFISLVSLNQALVTTPSKDMTLHLWPHYFTQHFTSSVQLQFISDLPTSLLQPWI